MSTNFLTDTISSQFLASLAMLHDCIRRCPEANWADAVGRYPFWQVAYHTLCFVDLYLEPDETKFQPRPDLHPAGWQEYDGELPSRRFEKDEMLRYVGICREKAVRVFAAETPESLAGPSGHARRTFSRAELHLYNLRHIQHHAGQLSALLRRIGQEPVWISAGWRE